MAIGQNSCIPLNIFTTKLKSLKEKFNKVVGAKDFPEAKKTKEKIDLVYKKADEFASDAIALILEETGDFSYVKKFVDGVAEALDPKGEKLYLINTKGEIIVKSENIMPSFNGGYAVQDSQRNYYFADSKGKRVSETYDGIRSVFREGFAIVMEGESYFYINSSYEKVLSKSGYFSARPFSNGIASVVKKGCNFYNLIDTKGRNITNQQFNEVISCREGLIGIAQGPINERVWKYLDTKGETAFVVEPPPNCLIVALHPFHEGVAKLEYALKREYRKNGEPFDFQTYIDKEGNYITKQECDLVEDFKFGLGRIKVDDKYYFIDKKGQRAFGGKKFNGGQRFDENGYLVIKNQGDIVAMDTEGNFYTANQMKDRLDTIETAGDLKRFFDKIGV